MNILAPVSTIMTTDLLTVNPEDTLLMVKEKFDQKRIHHLPVVRFKEIVGIISKTDLLYFLKGMSPDPYHKVQNEVRLRNYKAKDIMTTGLAKLETTDRINVASEVFKENLFHAIPVLENGDLVGIITTYDIIKKLAEEPANVS